MAQGWTDSLRARHPYAKLWTFWDYTMNAWARDAGFRIDHLMLSPEAADRLMQQVRRVHPSARLAVLSEHDGPEVRAQTGTAGGSFVGTRPEDVRSRVRDLLAGRRPAPSGASSVAAVAVDLTERETDVLLALDRGLAVRQAARALGLTEATVKGYMRTLFAKLSAHSRAEAVHKARVLGLLDSALAVRATP